MLECAIPQCEGRETFLRSGTLHLVDVKRSNEVIGKKMIWLCAGCTKRYAVQTWRPIGEQIQPRSRIPVLEFCRRGRMSWDRNSLLELLKNERDRCRVLLRLGLNRTVFSWAGE
jgi:hypothetical protein